MLQQLHINKPLKKLIHRLPVSCVAKFFSMRGINQGKTKKVIT